MVQNQLITPINHIQMDLGGIFGVNYVYFMRNIDFHYQNGQEIFFCKKNTKNEQNRVIFAKKRIREL